MVHIRVPLGLSGASVVKNPPANSRDMGSIPGLEKSPGGDKGNPLQNSCLANLKEPGGLPSMGSQKIQTQLGYTTALRFNLAIEMKKSYM